jgi:hypothetical protein
VRENWDLFPILKPRLVDQEAYEDIPTFVEILQTVEDGGEWTNCRSRKAVQKHWRSFEALNWTIKDRKYLSQVEATITVLWLALDRLWSPNREGTINPLSSP